MAKITPVYAHVLIDEAQDFGTIELEILRRLVHKGKNDIFLCGDVAQNVLPKCRSLEASGIKVTNRRHITKNYRNSRETLKAAYEILIDNLDPEMLAKDGLDLLDPEYANRSGQHPVALKAETLDSEFAFALKNAQDAAEGGQSTCIAFCGHTHEQVAKFAKTVNVPCLDGNRKILDAKIVLSDLEQTKGYEFDNIIIVNCTSTAMPPIGAPERELYRHACRLYVAMTRARHSLHLSYHGQISPWLTSVIEKKLVTDYPWKDVEEDPGKTFGVPPLPLFEIEDPKDLQKLLGKSGTTFLYTNYAMGCSLELLKKIPELVDGQGLRRNGKRVKWATLGDAYGDVSSEPSARKAWGPVLHKEFSSMVESIWENEQHEA
jgi:hypothetical protein